jgi:HlyD family secretion protein
MDAELKNLQIDRGKRRSHGTGKGSAGWIVGIALLLLLGFGGWAFLGPRLNATPVVEVQRVLAMSAASAPNGVVLNATGYIVAAHKIELAAKVVGKVSWIGVDKGDRVKEGQVLVRLEDDEYQAYVQQAKGQLASLQAKLDEALHGSRPEEVAQALANLNSAKADLENAKVSLDRARNTVKENLGSQQSLDDAQARYDSRSTR